MKLPLELRRQLGEMVRLHIRARYGTQAAAAEAWGVKEPFVSRVISGDKPPTDGIMADAGIELVAVYKRDRKEQKA